MQLDIGGTPETGKEWNKRRIAHDKRGQGAVSISTYPYSNVEMVGTTHVLWKDGISKRWLTLDWELLGTNHVKGADEF